MRGDRWTPGVDDSGDELDEAASSEYELVGGDGALYDLLTDHDFAYHPLEIVSATLVQYGLPILTAWVTSGKIFGECARRGRPVDATRREREFLRSHREDVDDLVGETLARSLVLLRSTAVDGQKKWSMNGGATLGTYFITGCVMSFPNVFRPWSREFRRRPDIALAGEGPIADLPSRDDPESETISDIMMRKRLAEMPSDVRKIMELKLEGSSHVEVAARLGLRSGRAVEGILRRYREAQTGGDRR
jgi:DNA-directed RNA polymerase specialized sigma24 family protein